MNFCEKCGRELQPGEVCNCQQPQAAAPENAAPKTNSAALAAPANDNKKLIIIIAAAAAVLLLIVVIAAVAMGGGSYKTPIKKVVSLINSGNSDPFAYQPYTMSPMAASYNKKAFQTLKKNEDCKELLDKAKDEMKDFYEDNKGFKITKVDFVKADEMKRSELREIEKRYDADDYKERIEDLDDMDKGDIEDAADSLDLSKSDIKTFIKSTRNYYKACSKVKISKGYEVTLRFYGKFEGDTDKTDKVENIRVIKMNGTWYIYDASKFFDGIDFRDDLSDVDVDELYWYISAVNFTSFF